MLEAGQEVAIDTPLPLTYAVCAADLPSAWSDTMHVVPDNKCVAVFRYDGIT